MWDVRVNAEMGAQLEDGASESKVVQCVFSVQCADWSIILYSLHKVTFTK